MKETSKVDRPLRRTPFLEAVAYHEAGHLIAAWRCRIAIKRATIVPKGLVGGSVHHENVLRGIYLAYDASARANDRADKLVIICLAGPAAQRRYRPGSCRPDHARSDYEQADRIALTRNGSIEATRAYLKWMETRAVDLVGSNWDQVEKTAAALLERGTLGREDVWELLMPPQFSDKDVAKIIASDTVT